MRALDRLTGGLLLGATAAGGVFALSLFEARDELIRLSGELMAGLADRLHGLDRFGRSERLAAAHAVIVIVAYFEGLSAADLPVDARDLELSKPEQAALAGGALASSDRLGSLADALLRAEIPMPAPQLPYEVILDELGSFYADVSSKLLAFVSGLATYERLDETRRELFRGIVMTQVPLLAAARYEETFRRLAAEFPEVAFWANLIDHQATREDIRRLHYGLESLERALAGLGAGRVPDERGAALWRVYRAAVDRPVLDPLAVPSGVTVPSLGEAYVDPSFRVASRWSGEMLGQESSWAGQRVRDDLAGFMAAYLTGPQAAAAPLLVLGQPGSGKSVLTQMLAARLPAGQFLVVRVVLRDVAADEDLQAQIEHGILLATGENITWPDLARSRGDALPVVLLDGFDELLQATGVSQSDYLRKAAEFQRREADLGRPTAVLVTSRVAVADRARPVSGMVALRLESFSEPQIRAWLEVWNGANADGFAVLGVRPLPASVVLAHADLASQPLLLMMLALYDADGNQLQRDSQTLSTADLYERLLTRFAEREVDRLCAALPAEQRRQARERELFQLSLAAFAMFNRGRQWVTEAELDSDLSVMADLSQPAAVSSLRAPLSTAQVTFGRFFFIYQARAIRDGARLKAYEFLHATFGEYLLARLVGREIQELAAERHLAAARARKSPADDSFLHALLSYVPLAMRGTVISFLAQHFHAQPDNVRAAAHAVATELFHDVMRARRDSRYHGYTPQDLAVPARYAAYSANLLTLVVLTADTVSTDHLYPGTGDPVQEWRNLAMLWRSQLPIEGWHGLLDAITIDRIWDSARPIIVLRSNATGCEPPGRDDPYWNAKLGLEHTRPEHPGGYSNWVHHDFSLIRRQAHFIADDSDDACLHALEPFTGRLGSAIVSFCSYWPDRSVSAANALINLWLTLDDDNPDAVASAYDTCLRIAIRGFAPMDDDGREAFRAIFLRHLATHRNRLPPAWFRAATDLIAKASGTDANEHMQLLREASDIAAVLHNHQWQADETVTSPPPEANHPPYDIQAIRT